MTKEEALTALDELLTYQEENGFLREFTKITISEPAGTDEEGNPKTKDEDRAQEIIYVLTKTVNTMNMEQVELGLLNRPNDSTLLQMRAVLGPTI